LLADLARQVTTRVLELIVVDDASPIPFAADGQQEVMVIRRDRNGGFGTAVNTGARSASHPLLLILNSDLRLGPHFVEELLAASIPWMPVVAGPKVVSDDGRPGYSARRFPTVAQHVVEWLVPLARWRDSDLWHRGVGHDLRGRTAHTSPTEWLVGAALLLPSGEFRAVGGFDERFFMNSEEIDLQRRLRSRGVPSLFVGSVQAVHAGGASSQSTERIRWIVASRRAYAEKWGGANQRRLLQAALTAATLVNLLWNVGRRMVGRRVRPLAASAEQLRAIWGSADGGR
jgi:N-acetylglucosaminyl-diphospho-decaprenol L-rhamnosyltransferase